MTILLRMDDKMNRQLTCSITDADTALSLSQELVHFGFINEVIFVVVLISPVNGINIVMFIYRLTKTKYW